MNQAHANTAATPAIVGTMSGRKSSETDTSRAAAARLVGPPHGRMFIVPAASAIVDVSASGSMRRRA